MKNALIDEAIYTASPDITKHRYNPLLGFLLTIASIILLWGNTHFEWLENHDLAAQWNLLISSCILCTGLTMVCYRFFGDSSAPIEKTRRERLYRMEYSFESNELNKIKAAVESGNFELLNALPRCYQPASQVICYRTDSGSIIAAQVINQQQPASEILVFREGEYAF